MSRAHRRLLACLGALSLCASLLDASREARAEVFWHGGNCGPATATDTTARADDEPRVDIDVVQQAAGWAATLTARYPSGATGTRYIAAASCAELERAVEVSLSLLESTDAAEPRAQPPAVPPSNTAAASVVVGDLTTTTNAAGEPPVDAAASSEREPWVGTAEHGFLRLAALAGTGGGRYAELGAALSGGLWLGRWGGRVELSARRSPSAIAAERDVSLEISRLAAAVELCGRSDSWIDWGLCAGPRLELVSGLASGPSDPERDGVVLPGIGAGAFLLIPIASRWSFSSELQGGWALRGAEASVRPWGRVYELPRLGASLLVGMQWEL